MEERNGTEKALVPPLLTAGGAGTAFGIGFTGAGPVTIPANIQSSSIYFRNGLSFGFLFMGIYAGARAFGQEDETSRSGCVAGFGACIGSFTTLSTEFCDKRMVYVKTKPLPLMGVARAAVGGGLMSLGLYGGLRTIFFGWDQPGSDCDKN